MFLKNRSQKNEKAYKTIKTNSEKLIKFKGNAKKTSSFIKGLIAKSKLNSSSLPQKMSTNNTGILKKKKIAANFSSFFRNIGQSLANDVPDSPVAFESYIKVS